MADYIEDSATVSDGSEDGEIDSDNAASAPPKKKSRRQVSSDEEEDEEGRHFTNLSHFTAK